MLIESANAGRMVNDQSLAGAAGDAQDYRLALGCECNEPGAGIMSVLIDDQTSLQAGAANATYNPDGNTYLNMNTPQQVQFAPLDEATYDIVITLGDGDGTIDNRPQPSGVYSDTLTFTIFDDDI